MWSSYAGSGLPPCPPSASFTIPVFAALAITGQDFVVLLLGESWAPAGPLLSIFAVRGIAQSVERTLGWLHIVAGRPDRWMRWGLFSTPFQLLALAVGLPFGPIGVAIAYTVAMFRSFHPCPGLRRGTACIGAKEVLAATGPQSASGLIAATLGYVLQQSWLGDVSQLTRFAISTLICLTIISWLW